jgi:pimeloyl-ACP methyl ester carboxylesterase
MNLLTRASTPAIQNPDAIASIERMVIGGLPHWVVLRGQNINNPLLVFFHGGPGASMIGAQRKYLSRLEEKFTVVHMDYRGAGKNFSPNIPVSTMTYEQLISDAYELIQILLNRFKQKKLFIMGQSFGATVGLRFVKQYPELVLGYIGVNQPIDRSKEEYLSYQYALNKAEELGDKKAVAELSRIGQPKNGLYKNEQDLVTQRKVVTKIGGVAFRKSAFQLNIVSNIFTSEVSWKEKATFFKGFQFSAKHLWNQFIELNFFEEIPSVEVPVFFVMGRYDRICHNLVEEYFHKLQAPHKELVIFKESAHLACFEEPEKFIELMFHKVLPKCKSNF